MRKLDCEESPIADFQTTDGRFLVYDGSRVVFDGGRFYFSEPIEKGIEIVIQNGELVLTGDYYISGCTIILNN